jgi:hypothetical protein
MATAATRLSGSDGDDANESRFCMCITPDNLAEEAQRLLEGGGRPPQRLSVAAGQHDLDPVPSGSQALP